jgi:DNA polymerase-3 subunit delta'
LENKMSWQYIQGHDAIIERFRRAAKRNRLAGTYLFVGQPGIGKFTFANHLAQALLCERSDHNTLEPCNQCAACRQVAAGSHPDLDIVSKPVDKNFIPIELFIGDREHRNREGLCFRLEMKPMQGGRKIAIIDDADYLNQEGANCLLKTLEEPPPRSIIILIASSEQKQLPTIRSRCQVIRFQPLSNEIVAGVLLDRNLAATQTEAASLASVGRGSVKRALCLADGDMLDFRERWLRNLVFDQVDVTQEAKNLGAFVDEAGKDASARRQRLRDVIEMSVEFYRELTLALSGTVCGGDSGLNKAIENASTCWSGDGESAVSCIDRCLNALSQVDANANQATLIECWLDDLSQLARAR